MAATNPDGDKLYIRIAREIRALIEDGQFTPGDRLPPLAELAAQFQCSRATIREALSTLRGQGLVEIRHGDGTYVRTAGIEMWMEPLDAAILLGSSRMLDLIEVMTAMLAGVAFAAAERRHLVDFSALSQALFMMECAGPDGEDAIATELSFYSTLAAGANNPVLENSVRVLQEALRSGLRLLKQAENEASDIGVKTCRAVYDAVSMGDPDAAKDAIFRYGRLLSARLRARAMRQV
ncbi:MAG: GntR family transcriptional regulator [Alicyclobacillus sp.]|nr:GntR family transcriptional regulator [Alicyclobacillus sp.]